MNQRAFALFFLTSLACLLPACTSVVEETSTPNAATLDPGVLTASLANGFSYYLRSANSAADNEKIDIRLVVKAGSLHETESQRGYAHLIEHMAYRGTKNFKHQDIEQLLADSGLKWGVDVNATTHYKATVYRFTLHQSDTELLPRLFDLMSDWLVSVDFDEAALEQEKRIVEAEWRERYAKRAYVIDPVTLVAYADSRFAHSAPIGDLNSIRSATVESLKEFYQSNYHPDSATLIVTGIKKPWQLEPLIKDFFDSIDSSSEPRERAVIALPTPQPLETHPTFLSYVNAEYSLPELSLNFIASPTRVNDSGEKIIAQRFEEQLLFKAFMHLLSNRLSKNELCDDIKVEASILESGHTIEHIKLSLLEDDVAHCLSEAAYAIQSVVSASLTIEEYGDFKQLFTSIAEDIVLRYRSRDAVEIAHSLVEWVVNGELSLSVWDLQKQLMGVIDALDHSALNTKIANIPRTHQLVYSVVGNKNVLLPTPAIQQIVENGHRQLLALQRSRLVSGDYHADQSALPEVATAANGPAPVKVRETGNYHEWRLRNGSTAILIQDKLAEQVAVTAIKSGGYAQGNSVFSKVAKNLPEFITVNGVGGYISENLNRIKNNKQMLIEPFVEPTNHGINASSRAEDLPLMLTMINGYFQEPMIIEPDSASLLNRIKNMTSGPGWYESYLNNNSVELSGEGLGELSVDQFQRVQSELFSHPADFGFVFVGNVDPAVLQQQLSVVSYARKLSNTVAQPVSLSAVGNGNMSIINHGEHVSEVTFFLACDAAVDADQFRQWNLLVDILSNRLRHSIRELRGLAYELKSDPFSVSAGTRNLLHKITFSVAPNDANEALTVVNNEVRKLFNEGVSEFELKRVLKQRDRDQFQRHSNAMAVANESALRWLVTKNIAPGKQTTPTVEGINQLAQCINTANPHQVVLNAIDNFNTDHVAENSVTTQQNNSLEAANAAEVPSGSAR